MRASVVLLVFILFTFEFLACFGQSEIDFQKLTKREEEYGNEIEEFEELQGVVAPPTSRPVCLTVPLANQTIGAGLEGPQVPAGTPVVTVRYTGGENFYFGYHQVYSGYFFSSSFPGTSAAYGWARKATANQVFFLDFPNDGGVGLVTSNYCPRDGKYTQISTLFGTSTIPAGADPFQQLATKNVSIGKVPSVFSQFSVIPKNDFFCSRGSIGSLQVNCNLTEIYPPKVKRSPPVAPLSAPFCFDGPRAPGTTGAGVRVQLKGGYGPYQVDKTQYYEGFAYDKTSPSIRNKVYAVSPQGAKDLLVFVDWAGNAGVTAYLLTFKPKILDFSVSSLAAYPSTTIVANALMFHGQSGGSDVFLTPPSPILVNPCL